MHTFYVKQKVFSLSGRFMVKNEQEQDRYEVQGSFLKMPKTFSVLTLDGQEVAKITKKTFSLLPVFFVEVNGQEAVTIKQEWSFLKTRYSIQAAGMKVEGNWLDMDFRVVKNGETAGRVKKDWFTWGDSYRIDAAEETELLMIALVVAIDCVKADQSAASSAATM